MTARPIPLIMLVLFFLFLTASPLAQVKSEITVIRSETTNGVLIVHAKLGEKPVELQCNDGLTQCARPQPATYLMVELPKGEGVYDCANVRLYKQAEDLEKGNYIGEYCLER